MPGYEADTPDTYGISFAAHPKYDDRNIRDLLSVEVTEYETHSDKNVIAFVKRKLSNKYLPNHYILLVHVNRASEKINTDQVFVELSKQNWRLGEICAEQAEGSNLGLCYSSREDRSSEQW